jgi:hypothetical protein
MLKQRLYVINKPVYTDHSHAEGSRVILYVIERLRFRSKPMYFNDENTKAYYD